MKEYRDQMNCTIRLAETPSRIVSLVPSQTQLLHDLGLEEEVIAITKFCIHPKIWFDSKERIGGTKSVDIEKVRRLKPDLIIGNKEENSKEDIAALQEIAPVWMSDIYSLRDALEMIHSIGELINRETKSLIDSIQDEFQMLHDYSAEQSSKKKSVLYFIWDDPKMVAGKDTFVDEMLSQCGLENATSYSRYPMIDSTELSPDYVFLSSEPFPFKEKHLALFQEQYPQAKIRLVDGEMFSWYGSKLKDAPSYFKVILTSLDDLIL
ncbi:MAG: ABC-type Fe3+-hydroxamate transport system substrate-binding protein [Crocinitomicaceae bacterium]|jgi:ABC-type Fe3+-hydroxamate transport system substrate-binding protein